MSRLRRLIREIHERSLWQALVVYLGASFAVLEALDMVIDYLGLPRWLWPVAFVFLLVGLPFVVSSSLAQEEEYGDEVPAGAAEAAAEEDRRLRVLTWRNTGAAFIGALAIWGALAAGWLLMGGRIERPVEEPEFDPANRIAVLPFSYRGDDEFAYLGEGMVDLLSVSLDGVGEVRTVRPRAVFSVLRQYEAEDADPDLSRTVARHLHAARFVEGEIVESDGQLRISARLVALDAQAGDVTAAMVDGAVEGGILGLVDDLSAQLLVRSEIGWLSQLGRVASLTTDSLAALKAFLEGVKALRAFELGPARAAQKRAVEIDSTFALAWAQLAELAMWGGYSLQSSFEAAERAMRWSEELPWREQQLVLGVAARIRGDIGAAEQHYRAVVQRYPEDVSALFGLSSVYHYAHLFGREWTEALDVARQAYMRAAEYEPDWIGPAMVFYFQALLVGDTALADSLFRNELSRWYESTDKLPFNFRLQEAFCIRDRSAQDAIVAEALSRGAVAGMLAVEYAGACDSGVWQGADIARALASRVESGRIRAWAHLWAAKYELALGHRGAARAEFDAARAIEPIWASQHETYWSLPAAFNAKRDELEAARASLLAREAPIGSPLPVPEQAIAIWLTTLNDSIQPHLQLYLLGRLSALLGDYDAALRYADQVESLDAPLVHSSVSQDKAQAIRAFVLSDQGRYEEALVALEAAPRTVNSWNAQVLFAMEPQERYLRAELLAELGHYHEALRWLSTIGYYKDESLRAPAHLLSARIHERVGAADSAAVHYKRFIDLWRDCDPELRPQVEAAERALERLTREPSSD